MKENYANLSGTLLTDFKFSHESYGTKIYEALIGSKRISDYQDQNQIAVPESMIGNFHKGDKIRLIGEYRSNDWMDENGKSHKRLYVFAKNLLSFEQDENTVILEGYICKTPEKRMTPRGFLITDLMLAVNRKNGRTDYIPCILWGTCAERAELLKVGDHIKLNGRMQSRIYQEEQVAYEVSGDDFEVIN